MVNPYDSGDLVRSLVRVVGSGFNYQEAGTKILNLAKVSSLAASVPISLTLPPILAGSPTNTTSLDNVNFTSNDEKLRDGVAAGILPRNEKETVTPTSTFERNATKRARTVSSSFSSPPSPPPKRSRTDCVTMTPEELRQQIIPRLVPVNTTTGVVLYLAAQPVLNPPRNLSDDATLAELTEERDKLKAENEELRRRLSLFQQLFRDKNRLSRVVNQLGLKINVQ